MVAHHCNLVNVCFDDIYMLFSIQKQGSSILDNLYAMVIGGFGMVAPVQGGFGAYHVIVTEGLVLLGISEESSFLFATIVHTHKP